MIFDINAWVGTWPFRMLTDSSPEGLLARSRKLPVGKQLVLVNFNPRLHHLQLFRWNTACQYTAIVDGDGCLAPSVPHMDMRQIMALVILEVHGHQDAVEHADRWHFFLHSRRILLYSIRWRDPAPRWYFYAPSLEAQGGTALSDYINTKGYLDFSAANKALGNGTGFWVNR